MHLHPLGFGFRVSCYERFHWSPETVGNLTMAEAWKLSVFFEEEYKYQKEQQEEHSYTNGTDIQVLDDDEETRYLWELDPEEIEEVTKNGFN